MNKICQGTKKHATVLFKLVPLYMYMYQQTHLMILIVRQQHSVVEMFGRSLIQVPMEDKGVNYKRQAATGTIACTCHVGCLGCSGCWCSSGGNS